MKTRPRYLTLLLALPAVFSGSSFANGVIEFAPGSRELNVIEGWNGNLRLQRLGSTSGDVSVRFTFVAITASSGSDFPTGVGTVLFKDGIAQGVAEIDLPQDGVPEHTETFQIVLINPTGGATLGSETTSLIRIRDNDWASEDVRHYPKFGTLDIPAHADPRTGEPSGPPPSSINVANIDDPVIDVRVKISDLSHERVGDLDIILESPTGRFCKLMSDYGDGSAAGNSPVTNLNLCFSDQGEKTTPSPPLVTGTWVPFDHDKGVDQLLDLSAVPSSGSEALAVFNNRDPNGTWKLHVMDDYQGVSGAAPYFTGELVGGWELILTLEPVCILPIISEVRNLNTVTVAFFFTGPANETFVWERATPTAGWEFVRDVTTLGEAQLQQLNSSKNGYPTAIYRFRKP